MRTTQAIVWGGLFLTACGTSFSGSSTGKGGSGGGGSPPDDSSIGGGFAGGGSPTGGSATTTSGSQPTGGGIEDCASACAVFYACALETDAAGEPLCPNADGTPNEEALFLAECEPTCASTGIADIADPNDCATTIATLKAVNPQFDAVCGDSDSNPNMGTCPSLCGQIYNCGVEADNCPAFTGDPAQRAAYIALCIPDCEPFRMTLPGLIDPANCSMTIATLSNFNSALASYCEFGLP
jgi:hypothetical protein